MNDKKIISCLPKAESSANGYKKPKGDKITSKKIKLYFFCNSIIFRDIK